ncbi:MAG: M28 family metallopeptidase [Gemmatimonadales bacterium]
MRRSIWLSPLLLAGSLRAQAPNPLDRAAETITAEDMRRRVEVLADDSMMGRDTPSPGLERAAEYVIGEFRRLGLRPAGEGGGYAQRFGISRWTVDTAASALELSAGSARAAPRLGKDVRWIGGELSGREIEGQVMLVAGPLTPKVTASPRLVGRVVLLVVDYSRPLPTDLGERVDQIARMARAVMILSNRDSATFALRLAAAAEPRLGPDFRAEGGAPVVELHERSLGPILTAAGIDPPGLRTLQQGEISSPARLRGKLRLAPRYLMRGEAPNLVGILEGNDPRLRREYVVITAHLDHIGVRPGRSDSIANGADDNASGVAALLELAEAFSPRSARPRRSLLFLAPSGEEKGLWGSAYFTERPTVPLRSIVADLNFDLIGRNWPDSVIASGLEMSTLGPTLMRVSGAHPELRMTPIADRWPEERIFYRSDHYNFARKGIPVLFFTSGTHPDYHQPTDSADRIDVEKASRLVRLLFHLGAAVADDPKRPEWSPESYRQIVERR